MTSAILKYYFNYVLELLKSYCIAYFFKSFDKGLLTQNVSMFGVHCTKFPYVSFFLFGIFTPNFDLSLQKSFSSNFLIKICENDNIPSYLNKTKGKEKKNK